MTVKCSWLAVFAVLVLPGCSNRIEGPTGPAAYALIAPANPSALAPDYRIGPGDTLNISTYLEKELTLEDVKVDTSGNILFPLVGAVRAAGRTSAELGADMERLLGSRWLKNPHVTISVTDAVSQKVTVEGSVVQPGVFDLKGKSTLLQALAYARGPDRTADTGHVIIFRMIDDQRQFAVFDVDAVRRGRMADPEILGDDLVMVPYSKSKGALRDILTALPALGVFAVFRR